MTHYNDRALFKRGDVVSVHVRSSKHSSVVMVTVPLCGCATYVVGQMWATDTVHFHFMGTDGTVPAVDAVAYDCDMASAVLVSGATV